METQAPKPKAKTWRKVLRRCRVTLLSVLLILVAFIGWLNYVGLPDFLKRPMVNALHARGLDLQFTRLRWRLSRGFVADNVRFGAMEPESNVPQFSVKEVELRLNHRALLHLALGIDAVILRGGQLTWQLDETNQPSESLSVTNIQTQVRLLANDQWELDHFTANFAGARMHLAGSLTNASALREWKLFHGQGAAQPGSVHRRLRELAKTIDNITFDQPPDLNVEVRGDARDPRSFHGLITLDAPAATTPWGTLTNGTLYVRLTAPDKANARPTVEFKLHADDAETPWGGTKHFLLNVHAAGEESLTNLVAAHLELSAAQFTTQWGQATNARFTADWTHSLTNPIPLSGTGELRLTDAYSRWGSVGELRVNASLITPATNGPSRADASWGVWAELEPYVLTWNCHLERIHMDDFKSAEVVCSGDWSAPLLTVTNLHTEMYHGEFTANASLDVNSRMAKFACISDFDVLQATPLLTPGGRRWFQNQEFEWATPPRAHASGSVTLPAWTNRQPDWREEVLPTLFLQGDFKVGEAGYHHVPVTSARSHFTYSNMVWNLPDLVAVRPEGTVEIEHISDDKTKDYYFRIHSTVDPQGLRGMLEPAGQRQMDRFVFNQPPVVDAEIWGRWHEHERLGAKTSITVSNFSYRGETATSFRGKVSYTNLFILLTDARVERTNNEYLTADSVGFDIKGKRAFLTNGFGIVEGMVIPRAIGPKISKDIEPYHFLKPPTIHAHGVIPLSDDISMADLHFQVEGGPFEWLRFRIPHIAGQVDWVGDEMTLSNMQADFYGGKMSGNADFDFHPKEGTDYRFDTIVTGASLGAMMSDLADGTNHLEGVLNGRLHVTQANTRDMHSWFGDGNADLHDGVISEIPIFGILSPLLDSMGENWGKTRVSEAAGRFTITNSIIRSDNLELRSPTLRLYYRGTVDFDMNVDAKVEAEVGRDTPLVGPLLGGFTSLFSKAFETHVTGTLKNPKTAPATWVGNMLNPFLHPWRTFKGILPTEPTTPPVYTDPPP